MNVYFYRHPKVLGLLLRDFLCFFLGFFFQPTDPTSENAFDAKRKKRGDGPIEKNSKTNKGLVMFTVIHFSNTPSRTDDEVLSTNIRIIIQFGTFTCNSCSYLVIELYRKRKMR